VRPQWIETSHITAHHAIGQLQGTGCASQSGDEARRCFTGLSPSSSVETAASEVNEWERVPKKTALVCEGWGLSPNLIGRLFTGQSIANVIPRHAQQSSGGRDIVARLLESQLNQPIEGSL